MLSTNQELKENPGDFEGETEEDPAELRIYCLVTAAQEEIFSVQIAPDKRVEDLRDLIMQGQPDIFTGVKATRVRLYAAKTSDGQWLSSTDEKVEELAAQQFSQVSGLLREKLDIACRVGGAFRSVGESQVHVLIVLPDAWSAYSAISRFMGRPKVEQKLWCLVVGEQAVRFSVFVGSDDDVGELQEAIKKKRENTFQGVDAVRLLLVLAKTEDGEWLHCNAPRVEELAHADSPTISALREARLDPGEKLRSLFKCIGDDQIHVLVLPPETNSTETIPADQWFPGEMKAYTRVDIEGESDQVQYFEMLRFPPMVKAVTQYSVIIERSCDVVIFEEMMEIAARKLERQFSAELVVTGNPGIGKSRFYLYCAFRLIRGHVEGLDLSKYTLVLNCDDQYHRYCSRRQAFLELGKTELKKLRTTPGVIRLIDAVSTRLLGWKGVSILFASPGVKDMRKFANGNTGYFVMPTWTLEDLQVCNGLRNDGTILSEIDLNRRYTRYGGIPRWVLAEDESYVKMELAQAVNSFDAVKMIRFVENNSIARESEYSHRVLAMVPTMPNFKKGFELAFLSKAIAQSVISKAGEEALVAISKFAVSHVNSSITAVFRGQLFEAMSHRWFAKDVSDFDEAEEEKSREMNQTAKRLQIRELHDSSIAISTHQFLQFPDDLIFNRFDTLDEIGDFEPGSWSYYRPESLTYAIDAFLIHSKPRSGYRGICYGLQMTLNNNHGIKAAGIIDFIKWIEDRNYSFRYVFIVPPELVNNYKRQNILTKTGKVHRKPGRLKTLSQWVAPLDPFQPYLSLST